MYTLPEPSRRHLKMQIGHMENSYPRDPVSGKVLVLKPILVL